MNWGNYLRYLILLYIDIRWLVGWDTRRCVMLFPEEAVLFRYQVHTYISQIQPSSKQKYKNISNNHLLTYTLRSTFPSLLPEPRLKGHRRKMKYTPRISLYIHTYGRWIYNARERLLNMIKISSCHPSCPYTKVYFPAFQSVRFRIAELCFCLLLVLLEGLSEDVWGGLLYIRWR